MHRLILLACLVVCTGVFMTGCLPSTTVTSSQTIIGVRENTSPSVSPVPAGYRGELVEPPIQLQDFTLPASTGQSLSLSDLDGQWRVIFFGYLHCPDFCPLTLAEYRQVKQLLAEEAAQVDFIYISVDGVRDTPEALRVYLANFDPDFIGLSGDDVTLARIQPDYGFYYQRRLDSGSQAVYVIDHSTRSYLVNPSGQLVATFTYDISPAAIASAIREHMHTAREN